MGTGLRQQPEDKLDRLTQEAQGPVAETERSTGSVKAMGAWRPGEGHVLGVGASAQACTWLGRMKGQPGRQGKPSWAERTVAGSLEGSQVFRELEYNQGRGHQGGGERRPSSGTNREAVMESQPWAAAGTREPLSRPMT